PRPIDDRRVFAGMGLPLMNDLAEIGAVLQYQVERTAREWVSADEATGSARPRLAFDVQSFELLLQQPDRAKFGIAAEDETNVIRLVVGADELAVLHPIAERRHAAHPHPLPF